MRQVDANWLIPAIQHLNCAKCTCAERASESLFQGQKKIVAYCTKAVLKYVAGFLRSNFNPHNTLDISRIAARNGRSDSKSDRRP
jgi:hypothetical protein